MKQINTVIAVVFIIGILFFIGIDQYFAKTLFLELALAMVIIVFIWRIRIAYIADRIKKDNVFIILLSMPYFWLMYERLPGHEHSGFIFVSSMLIFIVCPMFLFSLKNLFLEIEK